MLRFKMKQVDAFTTVPFGGNPAAVVLGADGLSVEQMQAIAREMNLSETVFVSHSDVADFRVRFFTPAREIDLAGHPTIATWHVLVEEALVKGEGLVKGTQELNIGVLPVEVEIHDGKPGLARMTQKPPQFLRIYDDRAAWAQRLGLQATDLLETPIQTVSTGTPQLMIPVRSLDALRRIRISTESLDEAHHTGDWFSLHTFTLETLEPTAHVHARHFAPEAGILEDPVTGSASGGMASYLLHYGLVDRLTLVGEQGHEMGRPGTVYMELTRQGNEITSVIVAGTAVTVLVGELFF